jgi:thiamine pyrophosphate-dependent acetolactate synthase large subunit-like protein
VAGAVDGHIDLIVCGSLGWSIGAAVGARLAAPDATIVRIVGDGSYLLGVPSTAYWMARRYGAPSLTVVLNNRGWKTLLLSTLAVRRRPAASLSSAQADFPFTAPTSHSLRRLPIHCTVTKGLFPAKFPANEW